MHAEGAKTLFTCGKLVQMCNWKLFYNLLLTILKEKCVLVGNQWPYDSVFTPDLVVISVSLL